MKYLHTLILVLISAFLFAQSGTTLEEYRYLTKGYAYQIEMGLDAKKDGYEIKPLYTCKNNVMFSGLYATDSAILKAIVAILSPNTEQPTFVCLPSPDTNPDVLVFYEKDKKALAEEQQLQLDAALREWQFQQLEHVSSNTIQPISDLPVEPVQTKPIEDDVELREADNSKAFTAKGAKSLPQSYEQKNKASISHVPAKEKKLMVDALVQLEGISDRTIVEAPVIPEGINRSDKVAVKICVDAEGLVRSAKYTLRGSTSMDPNLKAIAIKSAKATRFSTANNKESCGIMTFSFGK